MEEEIFEFSREDQALFQPFPFAVYVRSNSVVLNKYLQIKINGKQINWAFPVAKYRSVAELLLDFLCNDKWFHNVSAKQIEIIKEMTHRIYVEPRFPLKLPSVRYQNEIAKRKAHLYDIIKIKAPIASDIAEKINEKLSKMKKDGNPIPELPDYHTSEGMEACMEILKISPPKADGFQFPTADDLIFWALEETTKQGLIIAHCKECGQLFVKDTKDLFCSRRCANLGKVDCGRFCGDKEIKSLYDSIYKALDKGFGQSPKRYFYRDSTLSSSENRDSLFSDLTTKYENFTYEEHAFSESDFEVMNQTFRKNMFAPKYESFKCIYRRYKIQELSEAEYNVARTEFLDWLREVKSQVDNFVRE